jgi:hypothetical protein
MTISNEEMAELYDLLRRANDEGRVHVALNVGPPVALLEIDLLPHEGEGGDEDDLYIQPDFEDTLKH